MNTEVSREEIKESLHRLGINADDAADRVKKAYKVFLDSLAREPSKLPVIVEDAIQPSEADKALIESRVYFCNEPKRITSLEELNRERE